MSNTYQSYDKKYLIHCMTWLAVILGGMYLMSGIAFLITIPMMLLAYSRNQNEELLFWLMIVVSMLVCNSYFAKKDMIFALSQRGLLMVFGALVSVKVFGARKHPALVPFGVIILYVLFMIVPSFSGWCPKISFLKLLLFTVIYFAYFGIAIQISNATNVDARKIRSILMTMSMLFIFGSIALVPFPAISQLTGEEFMMNPNALSLFKGMTMQSQCLGPVVSVLSVAIFADMLFGVKKPEKLHVALLLCCPYLLYKTSSRTGMVSYLMGMIYTGFLFMKARGIGSRWKSKVTSMMMFVLMVLAAVVLTSSKFSSGITAFALKTSDPTSKDATFENMTSSRRGLAEASIDNFKRKPLIGNGFQVMESMTWNSPKSILTAPIEKGFWPTAVLEEGGVIGFGIFVIFLLSCLIITAKHGAYMASACLFVYTLANCGEFTFFSLSYVGGFAWAVIFAALIIDIQRLREQSRMRTNPYQFNWR